MFKIIGGSDPESELFPGSGSGTRKKSRNWIGTDLDHAGFITVFILKQLSVSISELKEMGMQEDDIEDLNELANMMHKFVSFSLLFCCLFSTIKCRTRNLSSKRDLMTNAARFGQT